MNEELQITKTIKKVLPTVVSITISKYLTVFENPFQSDPFGFQDFFTTPKRKKKVKIGGGSGFIVDKSGVILTNRHVVIDPLAEYVVILNDGRKFKAEVLARDQINDIAIIKINTNNLPIVKLGSSSKLNLGQTAIAVGNTLGSFANTVSVGVVSGLSRTIKAIDALERKTQSLKGLIQTDAAINPGNSGGPLVNIEGKIIGINCAMVFGAENVGFAIPIDAAKKDLNDIKKYGKIRQPFLGLRYILVDKNLQQKYGVPVNYGALVISENIPGGEAVMPGSPAEKAGVQEADIILEIQNKKITFQNSLQDILQEFKIGDEVELKVLRKDKKLLFKTILADKK